jgi:hypothetical protein
MMWPRAVFKDAELDRSAAQACFAANLGFPGAGSLMAGRRMGYGQAGLALVGVALTLIFGAILLAWYVQHFKEFRDPEVDPWLILGAMWRRLRWVLVGMGVFLIAWVWALATSLILLRRGPGRERS